MEGVQLLAVVAASVGFMLLIWRLKAWLLGSLRRPARGAYRVSGVKTAAELEHTVRSLIWQRAREKKSVYIIIDCKGFDSELLRMARIFARDCDYIILE